MLKAVKLPVIFMTLLSLFTSFAYSMEVVEVTMTRQGRHFLFTPQNLTIKPGTKVVWINTDNQLHNVISGTVLNKRPQADGIFKSPFLKAGAKFEYVFDKPGEFPYYCLPHVAMGMVGIVIVK